MKPFYKILGAIALLLTTLVSTAKVSVVKCSTKSKTAFAIIIDSETYAQCKKEVDSYRATLESEGLGTYIVAASWTTPEEVKAQIVKLKGSKPVLEGFVLVGDIPIVRVQRGQHLTTAFKMSETAFPISEASVPTDRFYDDLNLQFDFIKKDEKDGRVFYYNLNEKGAQQLNPEFYSARMLVPERLGGNKYEHLKKYLAKVVEAHKEANLLDRFTYFAGHGYNSDCMTAWRSQSLMFKDYFPAAYKDASGNRFLNFRQSEPMKHSLFTEMQRKDLDLMLFYEHGAYDTQYINGDYTGLNMRHNISLMKKDIRSALRKAEGEKAEKILDNAEQKLGLAASGFTPQELAATRASDSAMKADINISLADLSKLKMGARMAIFNACYNGSFHRDGYVAGYHIFNNGRTVVAQGNTVNVLQDKWADELIGYLDLGIRVGLWQKEVVTLESHLIGDPTYRFASATPNTYGSDLVLKKDDEAYWKAQLEVKRSAVRAMAIKQLSKLKGKAFSNEAYRIFNTDRAQTVRLQALKALAICNDDNFTKAVAKGIFDPCEMVSRLSTHWAGDIGHDDLIAPLVEASLFSYDKMRVAYAAQTALAVFDLEKVKQEYLRQLNGAPMVDADKLAEAIKKDMNRQQKRLENQLRSIASKEVKEDDRVSAIRGLRNNPQHTKAKELVAVLNDASQPLELRILLCEALGWFNHSVAKSYLVESIRAGLSTPGLQPQLKAEMEKTLKRLI